MGLCKCPKRRVTNLFCYEHRVNVCEHCLISRHYKCVVMSYLQWLQDSDYNSNCNLCNTPLTDEDTIRLICYDIFHWSCLNKMAAQLPKNTAPAGYQCPMCKGPIFPQANTVSPVANVLKERLSTVNWARVGLGLPLVRGRGSPLSHHSALLPRAEAVERRFDRDVPSDRDKSKWGETVPVDRRIENPGFHVIGQRRDGDQNMSSHGEVVGNRERISGRIDKARRDERGGTLSLTERRQGKRCVVFSRHL
ncbi:zinc finger protein-like 1 [Chiloscyllium punctatum]|uniref:zinc finger protein-like 1 n=1 Tax=Chiloscyllium punctatum TaxID=137246 RepID=UPI003B640CE4